MGQDQFLAKWIEGELSDEELKKLVSAEVYADLIKLRKGISLYEMTREPLSDEIYQNIKKEQQQSKKTSFVKILISTAAAVLLLMLAYHYFSPDVVKLTTAYGEQQQFNLPDGSLVYLGADSSLTYDPQNWTEKKNIYLKGNAYFEVSKNNTLTLSTQNGKLLVQGAKFSVNSFADYINLKCFEGKIKLTADKEYLLLAQQMLQKTGHQINKSKLGYHQPLWLKGEFRFSSTPLKYVLKAIEKQYGIHFINKNIDDAKLFTGSFNNDNLDLALKIVLNASNIKVSKVDVKTYVLSK